MSILYTIKKQFKNNPLFWRNVINKGQTAKYNQLKEILDDEQSRIITDLKNNGCAFSHIDVLFKGNPLWNELQKAIEDLEKSKEEFINKSKANVNNVNEINEKSFMLFLIDPLVKDKTSIWWRFGIDISLRKIANAYFKMPADLRYYNVWHTIPFDGEAKTSQLWHRDREDLQILKIFVYLTDVTDGAGPFTYAPGTHILGSVKSEPEYTLEEGVKRTSDEQMNVLVGKDKWIKGTVPAGTIAFADTHGYHKGGLARTDDRLLYTCMYTSPGCERHYFGK
ncbi:MAG: hypothetical protein SGJ04_00800 [Bacteroidota bacterium]|nr:hypothetical protein [Bacteroidota bacterium]